LQHLNNHFLGGERKVNIIIFVILLLLEIVCAITMRSVAKKLGANETAWFITGLILGPFAFILIPVIKEKNKRKCK
jgi:hypothetical protein